VSGLSFYRQRTVRAACVAASAVLSTTMMSSHAFAACDTTTPCVTGPTNLGVPPGGTATRGAFISADGSVVAGTITYPGLTNSFVWSNGVMTDIGTMSIAGLGANGTIVAGNVNTTAVTWTSAGGIVALAYYSGGNYSIANAISADGTTVVGYANDAGGASINAVRWVNGVVSSLGSLGGFATSMAYDVSADGSVIVGTSYVPNDFNRHGFRWFNGVMTDIGSLGNGDTYAQKVSADGSTVAGQSAGIGFRWNSGTMIPILLPGGGYSEIGAMTPDGSAVVGSADDGNGNNHAFRWKNGVVTDLTPTELEPYVYSTGVSNNGEVVVGWRSVNQSLVNTLAWRWTEATGKVELNTLLANAGVDMTGINLRKANGVSGDGQYIAGTGLFNGATRAFLLRYDDGAGAIVAGLTSPDAQQQSVTSLSNQRSGMAAQQHGLAAPLLGGDRPTSAGGEAGVFASGGSASAGGTVRYTSTSGFSIIGGAAWAREDYANTELKNSWIGAGALQYVYDGFGSAVRPLVEVGGWITPNASLAFSRTYANGAGTAVGVGNTKGDLSYVYGRAGGVFGAGATQIILSGEYGRQELKTAAYAEKIAGNPFNAVVSGGTDAMDVVKMRLQGSRDFGKYDATVWGAWAGGFNRTATYVTNVPGLGTLSPGALNNIAWAEYGVRIGYKISETVTADLVANGISGDANLGTRIHGGAGLRFRF
jgi:probable HAF family extracellular repeat protein